jgi:signal transduction histidine kinase
LVEQLQTEYNISASLTILGEKRVLSPETETTLFRIIQEALRNIAKHAEATKAHVSIVFGEQDTRVAIVDNGKGLELPSALGELSRQGKLGIDGMQTRARLVGGTFNIEAGPDSGTIITVKIPT